jgi:hypothetical protein
MTIAETLAAYTVYPTYTSQPPHSTCTPYPTYTQKPTLTAVIRVIIATSPPYTATITPTPTDTLTPTISPTPTLTPNRTQTEQGRLMATQLAVHEPGFYLVNVDIAPGVWRSSSNLDSCYWSRNDCTGEIVDNYFGFGGSTIFIAPTDLNR